jgi:hypothetical protein
LYREEHKEQQLLQQQLRHAQDLEVERNARQLAERRQAEIRDSLLTKKLEQQRKANELLQQQLQKQLQRTGVTTNPVSPPVAKKQTLEQQLQNEQQRERDLKQQLRKLYEAR